MDIGAGQVPAVLRSYRYKLRTIAFGGVHMIGRWRVKLTTVTVRGLAAHFTDEIEAAWACARPILEAVPDRGSDAGVAFMTVHVGMAGVWLLLDWWDDADLLRHRHFQASIDDPTRFRDVGAEHFGPCVWELAVQAHERQAWLKHVLCNPAGPSIEGYLADGLTGIL